MIWNEARYPTTVDLIASDLRTLSASARIVFSGLNGTDAIQTMNSSDPAAIAVFSNPWELASINLQPTSQGSRLIYNTILVILILLQQFFFLTTMNGVASNFQLFSRVHPTQVILRRLGISIVYTLGGSLCAAGAIWAFRSDWPVSGIQWTLTWLSLWLFAHSSFFTFDVVTIWVPAPFVSMALVTWVVLNVGSTLLPLELTPGFYKWSYMVPAHALYELLVNIWSGGCNPRLAYALPVLFAYELSSGVLSMIGVYRRSHYAVITEQQEEERLQEKIGREISKYRESRRMDDDGLDGLATGSPAGVEM